MAGRIGTIVVELEKWPDLLWAMRNEMATMLREQADAEASGYVAQRLREIAAAFSAGSKTA